MSTILLVEDNKSSASLVEDVFLFDRIPARLAYVGNGEEALRLAVSLQPVLILMDLRLPGINGLETTKILKQNPLTKDIPIWAITAYAMPGDEKKTLEAGCEKYFAKPLPRQTLVEQLKSFLQDLENTESRKDVTGQSTNR